VNTASAAGTVATPDAEGGWERFTFPEPIPEMGRLQKVLGVVIWALGERGFRLLLRALGHAPRSIKLGVGRQLLAACSDGRPSSVVCYDRESGEARSLVAVLPDARQVEYPLDRPDHARRLRSGPSHEPVAASEVKAMRGTSRESRPRRVRRVARARAGPSDDPDDEPDDNRVGRVRGRLGVPGEGG
jgi:hypothetical protein